MHIVYIDPQSYNNLAIYDCCLLQSINQPITMFGSDAFDTTIPQNVRLCRIFHYNKKSNSILKSLSYLWSYCKIAKYIVTNHPQIIHIQWIKIPLLDRLFVSWCHFWGSKVIFTAHNLVPHESGHIEYLLYKKYYHSVDAIIVHTDATKEELQSCFDIFAQKIHIIQHGYLNYRIDPNIIQSKASELRKTLHIQDHEIVFSMLGIQSPYKGCPEIAKVWETNQDLHANRLLLIGKQQDVDYSNIEHIPGVVIHNSFVSIEDFMAYLSISDVILLPYKKISQSGVLLTILKQRVPYLATDVGGLTEPLRIADVGWSIPYLDTTLLADKIRYICQHPEEIKFKKNTKDWRKLDTQYDWANIGRTTYELYNNLIGNSHHNSHIIH